ncbi:hypothetical protein MHYP_G00089180 [Metynnis hypsauchen]
MTTSDCRIAPSQQLETRAKSNLNSQGPLSVVTLRAHSKTTSPSTVTPALEPPGTVPMETVLKPWSSESSDSTGSAETDEQASSAAPQLIGEEFYASESDITARAPTDVGRPNENGCSSVTVSLRDENTNALNFATQSEDSRSSESSGLGDEGMQADEPTMTRVDVTDEINSRSEIVGGENKMGSEYSPNASAIEDKTNSASVIYPPDQLTTDFNSIEAPQKAMHEFSDDIQADDAFIALPHYGKAHEERSSAASNGEAMQASESSMSPKPFYTADHRFDLSSEVTYPDNSTVLDSIESDSSLEDIDASNSTDFWIR